MNKSALVAIGIFQACRYRVCWKDLLG